MYKATSNSSVPADKPMSEMMPGEIGVLTARPDAHSTNVGDYVVCACDRVAFPESGRHCSLNAPGYRYRPLAPGESVTFTRPKD